MFIKIKPLLITLLLVGFVSCDTVNESFTDGYSEDPNNPTDAPADKVFVAGQVGSMQFIETHTARLASMWAQYFSGEDRQYLSSYNYTVTGADFDNTWFLAYVRGLTNLQIAREKYEALEVIPESQVAATKVLEALLMGQVTALWGDVPYSEAVDSENTETPAYDPQPQVYDALDQILDEAIATLEGTSVPISEDITTLNGDPEKWLKVAYTIKARHYMHTGDYEEALSAAQNGIDAADGSGDMFVPHGFEIDRDMNLWHNFIVFERSGYLQANDAFAVELLEQGNNPKTNEQARIEFYYTTTSGGGRVVNTTDGFAAADAPYAIVTYMENQLIIAEVEARQESAANDQNAIDALNDTRVYLDNKFGTDNYEDLDLLDFQAGGPYSDITLLQHVFNWAYLGFIGQSEGFNFLRRIDYDVQEMEPITGTQFPQRFLYPQTERNTNPNVPQPAPGLYVETPVNQDS